MLNALAEKLQTKETQFPRRCSGVLRGDPSLREGHCSPPATRSEETPGSQRGDAASHHPSSQGDFTACFPQASPPARTPHAVRPPRALSQRRQTRPGPEITPGGRSTEFHVTRSGPGADPANTGGLSPCAARAASCRGGGERGALGQRTPVTAERFPGSRYGSAAPGFIGEGGRSRIPGYGTDSSVCSRPCSLPDEGTYPIPDRSAAGWGRTTHKFPRAGLRRLPTARLGRSR